MASVSTSTRGAMLLLLLVVILAASSTACAFVVLGPPPTTPAHHSRRALASSPRPAVLGGLWGGGGSAFKTKGADAAGEGAPKKALNAACRAKAQEYARGATTAPALLAFLKGQAAKDRKGPTLVEMVEQAVALVPAEGNKRALLLSSYKSVAGAAQAAKLTKFAASASLSPSPAAATSRSSGSDGSVDSNLVGGKYRLEVGSGGPRISSGKSAVVDAVRVSPNTNAKGLPVKVKLSRNLVTLKREAENLGVLSRCRSVIGVLDFLENYDRRGGHALVLEAGEEDLVAVVRRGGAQGRGEIKRVCAAALDVLSALERQQLVWTDLRASNFVRVGKATKAIDLESAVPVGERPVDCTPEVTPPEVARSYVAGQLGQARVAPSYDVWSLGCLVLFLASGGKTLFHGQPPNRAMLAMATLTPEIVSAELQRLVPKDARTRAFLERLLVVDPAKRPALGALRRDLYLASPF